MTTLQPHQQRVVEERADLSTRLDRLRTFLRSSLFEAVPQAERARLQRQSVYMSAYLEVLDERIAAFPQA